MTKFFLSMALILILQGLLHVAESQISVHKAISASPGVTSQNMLMEDKIRLGSTPPSCRNRCNQCDPCAAVQVPTLPGPVERPQIPMEDESYYKRYPNYKPLGWKCRCGNRLFNP
ncbi:EPIDERMAL PATTERNING FACTOR-like protein [Wolffia australiana]